MTIDDETIRHYLDSIIYIETTGLTAMENADPSDAPLIEQFITEQDASIDFNDFRDCVDSWAEMLNRRNGDIRSVITCAISEFYGYHWRLFLQRFSADTDDEVVVRLEEFATRPLAFIPVFNLEAK